MGTELQNRGVQVPLPLWSANANIDYPQIVMDIHKDYINAGSDIITTNTFRSTEWTYKKAGYGKNKSLNFAKLSSMIPFYMTGFSLFYDLRLFLGNAC